MKLKEYVYRSWLFSSLEVMRFFLFGIFLLPFLYIGSYFYFIILFVLFIYLILHLKYVYYLEHKIVFRFLFKRIINDIEIEYQEIDEVTYRSKGKGGYPVLIFRSNHIKHSTFLSALLIKRYVEPKRKNAISTLKNLKSKNVQIIIDSSDYINNMFITELNKNVC